MVISLIESNHTWYQIFEQNETIWYQVAFYYLLQKGLRRVTLQQKHSSINSDKAQFYEFEALKPKEFSVVTIDQKSRLIF